MTESDANTIEAAQEAIADEFAYFGDWTERYQYLIDLGRKLPPLPESLKTDAYKVQGCQSQVWLVPTGVATELETELPASLYSALKAKRLPSICAMSAGLSSRPPRASMGSATPAPPMEELTAPTPWRVWPLPAQAAGAARRTRARDRANPLRSIRSP